MYTWGMDPFERDRRRQEIESDLWESQHDEADSDAHIAGHVLARLAGGVVDDLRWRADHRSISSARALVALGTTGVIAAAVWVFFLAQIGAVPAPPPPPAMTTLFDRFPVPPPPPPPPPPPRPSIEVQEEMRVPRATR